MREMFSLPGALGKGFQILAEGSLRRAEARFADVLQNKHRALMALVVESRSGYQHIQAFDSFPGLQLHAHLAPDAFLAGKGLVHRSTHQAVLAERAIPAPRSHIPRMQAVEDLAGAMAQHFRPNSQVRAGCGVVIQDHHVPVYQEYVRRHGVEQRRSRTSLVIWVTLMCMATVLHRGRQGVNGNPA